MIKEIRIGVVLSSGGGRGVYAHTGFLQALQNLGIEISAITGCSAGALVGGVFASGTDLDFWSNSIANVKTRDYWKPDSWLRFLWQMIRYEGRGYTGFSDTQNAIAFLRNNLAATRFEDCLIPFHSLAMNLSRGEKTFFSRGELAPRIMASAAIPILYRPVKIENDWYSDGATIDLAPTEAICCKHDLDVLLVNHTAIHREGREGFTWINRQPWTLIEMLNLLLFRQRPWYLSNLPLAFHNCPCGCGATIVVFEPELPELDWPVREGGTAVQQAAKQQALELWHSHQAKISSIMHTKSPQSDVHEPAI